MSSNRRSSNLSSAFLCFARSRQSTMVCNHTGCIHIVCNDAVRLREGPAAGRPCPLLKKVASGLNVSVHIFILPLKVSVVLCDGA
jgi:hypothetical protein